MVDKMLYFAYLLSPLIGFMKSYKAFATTGKYLKYRSVFSNPVPAYISKSDRFAVFCCTFHTFNQDYACFRQAV